MTNMSHYLVLLACMLTVDSSAQMEFYVSPGGNDRNAGTKDKPFMSIQQAQQAIRGILLEGQKEDIVVWIGEGTYFFTGKMSFGPEDSGQDNFHVIYRAVQGEHPVISGGMEIKGWKKNSKGYWVSKVPENMAFRELFVNGVRAARARHPNSDYLRVAMAGADKRTNFLFHEGDFPRPEDPRSVEIVLLHDWSVSRITAADIDYSGLRITAVDSFGAKGRGLEFFRLDGFEEHPRYFLENSPAFLDMPGEWFLDQGKGLLYLIPDKGQRPGNCKVIASVTGPHLLEMRGTMQKKIKNISFHGISFQHCSWSLPENGYAGIQACHHDPRIAGKPWVAVPAAADLRWAENCSFTDCSFMHLGGSGLSIGMGCTGCSVQSSRFEDISGNGIMVGDGSRLQGANDKSWWESVPEQLAEGNSVSDNTVTGIGKQFYGAVGIWAGVTSGTIIRENQVFHLPYSGISVGWEWSAVPTPCRNNKVEGNHIFSVMETLSDGAGIYMLGLQPGSEIVNNLIHDIKINAGRAESNGMFLDEGSTELTISGNIIYHIAKSPLRFHRAGFNQVKGNILSCKEDIPPVRYNRTPEENISLINNIILKDSDPADKVILEEDINQWKSLNQNGSTL